MLADAFQMLRCFGYFLLVAHYLHHVVSGYYTQLGVERLEQLHVDVVHAVECHQIDISQ